MGALADVQLHEYLAFHPPPPPTRQQQQQEQQQGEGDGGGSPLVGGVVIEQGDSPLAHAVRAVFQWAREEGRAVLGAAGGGEDPSEVATAVPGLEALYSMEALAVVGGGQLVRGVEGSSGLWVRRAQRCISVQA